MSHIENLDCTRMQAARAKKNCFLFSLLAFRIRSFQNYIRMTTEPSSTACWMFSRVRQLYLTSRLLSSSWVVCSAGAWHRRPTALFLHHRLRRWRPYRSDRRSDSIWTWSCCHPAVATRRRCLIFGAAVHRTPEAIVAPPSPSRASVVTNSILSTNDSNRQTYEIR